MVQALMRRVLIIFVICLLIKFDVTITASKLLRPRRNVDVSNKYTQLTINTLRVLLNHEDLYFCNGDPYAGVQCQEEIVCVDWQEICDGKQTCGVPNKEECITKTVASYGTVDKRLCDGDENDVWCVWKKMAPQRCGRDYFITGDKKSKRRRIRSMNFPKNYYNDRFCFWRIRVPEGDKISVYFRQFNTELNYDFVSVGNGEKYDNDRETVIYKHSGDKFPKPKSFTSTGNVVWLTFKTDDWDNRKGFVIDFYNTKVKDAKVVGENAFKDDVNKSCGNPEVVELGLRETIVLTSPNHPDYYAPNMECTWKFKVGSGRHLSVNFVEFSTEEDHDVLSIGDGLDPRRLPNLLRAFSGRKAPQNIVSKSNQIWVKFETNVAINRRGFEVHIKEKYFSDCGGRLQIRDGGSITMTSPNFPDNYLPSSDCEWQFVISRERQLTFVILEFSTEDNYDKFSLGYGLEPDENMTNAFIREYSGYDVPTETVYTTTGSEGWMLFTSDEVSQMKGFLIDVYDKEYYDELFPSEKTSEDLSGTSVDSSSYSSASSLAIDIDVVEG